MKLSSSLLFLALPSGVCAWLVGNPVTHNKIRLPPSNPRHHYPQSVQWTSTQLFCFSANKPPGDESRRDFLMESLAATAALIVGGVWTAENLAQPAAQPIQSYATATARFTEARDKIANEATQWISTHEFSTLLSAPSIRAEIERVQFSGVPDTVSVHIVFQNGSHWRIKDVNTQDAFAQAIARLCDHYHIEHNLDELEGAWEQRGVEEHFGFDDSAAAALFL